MVGFHLTPDLCGFLPLIKIDHLLIKKMMKIARVALQKLAQKSKFDQICCLERFGRAKPSYFHEFFIKKWSHFHQLQETA